MLSKMDFVFAQEGDGSGTDNEHYLETPVRFSSSAIFSTRDYMEACPIPFSAILSPFALLKTSQPVLQHRAVFSCSNSACGAYCSPFCKVREAQSEGSIEWCCCFCDSWTISNTNETETIFFATHNPVKNDEALHRLVVLTSSPYLRPSLQPLS